MAGIVVAANCFGDAFLSVGSLSFLALRPGDHSSRLVLSKAQAKKAIERSDEHGRNFRGEYLHYYVIQNYLCVWYKVRFIYNLYTSR